MKLAIAAGFVVPVLVILATLPNPGHGTTYEVVFNWLWCAVWGPFFNYPPCWGTSIACVAGEALVLYLLVGVLVGAGMSLRELRRYRWRIVAVYCIARIIVAFVTLPVQFMIHEALFHG